MTRPQLPRPARRALHRRQSDAALWLAIGILLTGPCFTHATLAAGPLPQGGTYVAGTGAIASQGNGLVITQPGSTRGVIEWNSFSIGRNNSVTFDNGAGATLNRVTGGSPSAIFGRLTATGSLYVINPQGIVVGPSGVISTGGRFVASTLDVWNCAFTQDGDALTLSGDSNASVINLGRISSSGGDVFLIARRAVINAGTVAAPNGTAELAAGEKVLLQDSNSSRQVFVQTGSQGTVVNRGRIEAAQISLQAADGNVYALAGGGTRIRATGTANRDGHVWLVAEDGRVAQYGRIAASNADGSGGTVDTETAQLAFGKHAAVHAGQWNLSTPAFTIDDAAARALQRSLNAGTSVDLTTTGANGATGDLGVASSLRWSGPASLTLAAYHDVSLTTGTAIANNGAGNLTLRADASGIDNGGSVVNSGTIDWSKSTGIVSAFYDMSGRNLVGTQLVNATWKPDPESGLEQQITAYQLVNSVPDLEAVNLDVNGNYALGRDIDAPAGVRQIGSTEAPFGGQFDGMGHTLSHLGNGLFSVVGTAGIVRNVGIVDAAYHGYGAVGFVADTNYGTVAHAYSTGTISSESIIDLPGVGGLVGTNYGTVQRSWSSVGISGEGYLGGLVGHNASGATIRESYATGSVDQFGHGGPGGLVGINEGLISASYATGNVSASSSCGQCGGNFRGGGGLAYYQTGTGRIEQSFSTGLISQYYGIPSAVVGANGGTIASDVYYDKETSGATQSGIEGNGLTTAQMSRPESFGASWDFSSNGTWAIPAGETHPVLRWQLAPF